VKFFSQLRLPDPTIWVHVFDTRSHGSEQSCEQRLIADIATPKVDATNEGLLPSCVCEAVFRSASPKLVDACQKLAPYPTSEALITAGFLLAAEILFMP